MHLTTANRRVGGAHRVAGLQRTTGTDRSSEVREAAATVVPFGR